MIRFGSRCNSEGVWRWGLRGCEMGSSDIQVPALPWSGFLSLKFPYPMVFFGSGWFVFQFEISKSFGRIFFGRGSNLQGLRKSPRFLNQLSLAVNPMWQNPFVETILIHPTSWNKCWEELFGGSSPQQNCVDISDLAKKNCVFSKKVAGDLSVKVESRGSVKFCIKFGCSLPMVESFTSSWAAGRCTTWINCRVFIQWVEWMGMDKESSWKLPCFSLSKRATLCVGFCEGRCSTRMFVSQSL